MAKFINASAIQYQYTGKCILTYCKINGGRYFHQEFSGIAELVSFIRENNIDMPISRFYSIIG